MNWNTRLFFKINGLVGKNKWLDIFSWLGAEVVVFVMLACYLSFYGRYLASTASRPITVSMYLFFAMAWAIGMILSLFIGWLVRVPRPYVTYSDKIKKKINTLFSWKSFPSDHAMSAFLLLFLLFNITVPWTWILIILALWVCWGRIFVGVHYPLDIIGGAFVAYISLYITNFIFYLINFGVF